MCISVRFSSMVNSLMSPQLVATVKTTLAIFIKNTNPKTHFLF
jgi:hypothetical protein